MLEESDGTPSTTKIFDMGNLRENKEPNLEHRWTGRRRPQKDNCNLKDSYDRLAKVKMDLYEAEMVLAKERIKREAELHELKKESLALEIKKRKLEIKKLEGGMDF